MDECFKCGVSEDKEKLFDAISDEGIVKICENCSSGEYIPVIKKPTNFQLKEAERKHTVYERLSRAAGITHKTEKIYIPTSEDVSLRALVERKYRGTLEPKKPRPDLVDNYDWVIMMARRKKKISQEQLAKDIGEQVPFIKMAEKGILPEDDSILINKLEAYLSVRLRKSKENREFQKQPVRMLEFKKEAIDRLTISDLKRIKQEKEKESLTPKEEEIDTEILEEDVNLEKTEEINEGEAPKKGFIRRLFGED